VYYWDENDGRASSSVKVDGVTVDSWTWNQNLGSSGTNLQTYTVRKISNVSLDSDARIVVEGIRDGGEILRIDKIVLAPPALTPAQAALPAFEGAEGFGAGAVGGRGGWIVKVTNLNDSGVGSLRWALQDLDMPRIVVFEVGGLITLTDNISVNGRVTVAGQTAPGDGVTIRGAKLDIVGDDVIIRGLKLRPGGAPGTPYDDRDALSIGTSRQTVENVIIDGNSMSWATDEVLTVWSGSRNVSISNNIIAEGLNYPDSPDVLKSYGMLIGEGSRRVSVVDNLFMSNSYRNPSVSDASEVEIINNYVYNFEKHGVTFTMRDGFFTRGHVIGNYFEKGPNSGNEDSVRLIGSKTGGAFYLEDNLNWVRTDSSMSERSIAFGALATLQSSYVFTPSGVSAIPAANVKAHVLANAGARANGLDQTDARLLAEIASKSGGVKSVPPPGAYNVPTVVNTLRDTDNDGIPDLYETILGSDRFVFDPHRDVDGNGYGEIEDYINGLMTGRFDGVGAQPFAYASEAEGWRLVGGFAVETSSAASGGARIAGGFGAAEADHLFRGGAGRYDIVVRYFDENDGAARLAVKVDGVTVDEWLWSKDLGTAVATPSALTQRVIPGIDLMPGQVISLVGRGQGGEPLRIDRVDFTPQTSGSDAPVTRAPAPLRVEAESMTLLEGFVAQGNALASGGAFIAAPNAVNARAAIGLDVAPALYDVAIRHSDENDAVATLSVSLNGREIDAWLWDQGEDGPLVTVNTLVDRVIRNVAIAPGDVLEFAGQGAWAEPLRIDSFLLTPVGDMP
jgi:hypothetical protein